MTLTYSPILRCIYCGGDKPPLSREHIIPSGLAGDRILPRASCEVCRKTTQKLEELCLRQMMGRTRIVMGIHTDHPEQRPSELPVYLVAPDQTRREILVAADRYPLSLVLPRLPPARALKGLPDDGAPVDARIWHFRPNETELTKFLLDHGANSMVLGQFEPLTLVRMLAKIAHAYAVAEFGMGTFVPYTVDLILGRNNSINHLVGCWIDDNQYGTTLHHINHYIHNKMGIIVVAIRLFACLGAPTYHVVVGIKKNVTRCPRPHAQA